MAKSSLVFSILMLIAVSIAMLMERGAMPTQLSDEAQSLPLQIVQVQQVRLFHSTYAS